MKKFCRVFFKGEPVRWFDFPLPDDAENLLAFVSQMRFEGFAVCPIAYVTLEEVRGCMFIQVAEGKEPPINYTKGGALQ